MDKDITKTLVGQTRNADLTALTFLKGIAHLPLEESEEDHPEGSLIWALQQNVEEIWAPEIAEKNIRELINASNISDDEKKRLIIEARCIIEKSKNN